MDFLFSIQCFWQKLKTNEKVPYLLELVKVAKYVVILDHHKSSFQMITDNKEILSKISNLLIEFDGIQHFKPVKLFGGEKEFEKTKIKDEIKRELRNEK